MYTVVHWTSAMCSMAWLPAVDVLCRNSGWTNSNSTCTCTCSVCVCVKRSSTVPYFKGTMYMYMYVHVLEIALACIFNTANSLRQTCIQCTYMYVYVHVHSTCALLICVCMYIFSVFSYFNERLTTHLLCKSISNLIGTYKRRDGLCQVLIMGIKSHNGCRKVTPLQWYSCTSMYMYISGQLYCIVLPRIRVVAWLPCQLCWYHWATGSL